MSLIGRNDATSVNVSQALVTAPHVPSQVLITAGARYQKWHSPSISGSWLGHSMRDCSERHGIRHSPHQGNG